MYIYSAGLGLAYAFFSVLHIITITKVKVL